MARSACDRHNNTCGHKYQLDGLTRLYICSVCGTCERQNGVFWWAGKWSRNEPPCGHDSPEQRRWHDSANTDPDS